MSGSRLPGDSEDTDRHRSDQRVETRLSGGLAERYDAFQAQHGVTDADLLRDALREYLPGDDGPEFVRPRDEELAEAYHALAGHEKRVREVSAVVDTLSRTSHPSTRKDIIQREILPDLERTGLLNVKNGRVGIHPLTPVDEVDL